LLGIVWRHPPFQSFSKDSNKTLRGIAKLAKDVERSITPPPPGSGHNIATKSATFSGTLNVPTRLIMSTAPKHVCYTFLVIRRAKVRVAIFGWYQMTVRESFDIFDMKHSLKKHILRRRGRVNAEEKAYCQ